ncbi:Indole-3-butyric acid response 10 [Hibiscus syriacus]|uniref:Indole-3-butyric acid response 10 n=1 Tax=Hibiscus syriacus TaxID=106335 RepID=A0A6A3D2Y1_HIBSY|nr:Indole-3-butyric acid response 10 [Hibiscus syriacus]KAE8734964.1 Indole-3-butyric acid response 10 [Hibiscus syriacus]
MCSLEKRGNLFILAHTGKSVEHRLNPNLISLIIAALSRAKPQSNQEAQQRFDRLLDSLKPLILSFISLPIPTVAAVNGNAVAAGVMLAFWPKLRFDHARYVVAWVEDKGLGGTENGDRGGRARRRGRSYKCSNENGR